MKDLIKRHNTLGFLREHKITPQKKYGQNFLVNEAALDAIINGAKITKNDTILEIGAGIGTLTQALVKASGRVICVEIDQNLIPFLKENLAGFDNYEIIEADFLKLDLKEELKKRGIKSIKICANLPYYITTPILMKIFKSHVPANTITITVQKELALRMVADPGGKDYGALTLAVNYFSVPRLVFVIPKEGFIPKPRVDSAIVKLEMSEEPAVKVSDEELFFKFIKAVFERRRKTLVNSIKNFSCPGKNIENTNALDIQNALSNLGLPSDIRGERLSLKQFACIFNLLFQTRGRH